MRVAHVNIGGPRTRVDGVEVAVDTLAGAQRALGAEIEVVRDWSGWRRLAASWRPQLVHLHSAFRPAHVRLAARLRVRGVPYVVSPHSALSVGSLSRQGLRKRVWIALFDRRLLRDAAAVFCLSEVEARDIRRFAPRARTEVVPNIARQPQIVRQRTGGSPAPAAGVRPTVVTLARFDVYQKGLDRLAEIAAAAPEVDFVVHGDFDDNGRPAAQRLIAARPPNLRFRAPVSGAAKEDLFASATLYLQPSRWEGMSMAVIEAMIRGLPCAVSGYIADSMGPAAAGACLVLPDDPAGAARMIRDGVADPARLAQLGSAARRWAGAELSPERIGGDSLALYQQSVVPRQTAGRRCVGRRPA